MSTEPSWEALAQIVNRDEHHRSIGFGFTTPDLEKAAKAVLAEGYHLGHEHNEYGVFHKNRPAERPLKNLFFANRKAAEEWVKEFLHPEDFVVLGRYTTDWR